VIVIGVLSLKPILAYKLNQWSVLKITINASSATKRDLYWQTKHFTNLKGLPLFEQTLHGRHPSSHINQGICCRDDESL
jgi:hypothetical protein